MNTQDKPLILITNDDSVDAPGIHALAETLAPYADLYIIAPDEPRSGQSSAITVGAPLHIRELAPRSQGVRVFTISGTPVDCVKLGLHAVMPRKPDMLLSGINHGSNSGNSVIYSGTMGAVMEGCMNGIPSVGFSLTHHSMKADFSLSIDFVRQIALKVLEQGLPDDVCLNVNIPAKVTPVGVKVCRAARGYWTEEYKRYLDPSGNPFFWLTGSYVNSEPDATDTDLHWLARNYISVVPVKPDQSYTPAIKVMAKMLEKEQ